MSRSICQLPQTITVNTTLQPTCIYVAYTTVTVNSGVLLTIKPGVIVKFDEATELIVRGDLHAIAVPDSQIVFTSLYDDSYGGDTNSDGNGTVPTPGVWSGLAFENTTSSSSRVDRVRVRFGGSGGTWDGGIRFAGGTMPRILRTTVEQCGSAGLYVNGSAPEIIGCTVEACQSTDRGYAVAVAGAGSPSFYSATYPNLSNVFEANTFNAVAHLGGTIDTSTWKRSGYPWHVLSSTTVQIGQRLTLEPGLVVKLSPGAYIATREYQGNTGSFSFVGTAPDSIIITSLYDDAYGGDSNNDGTTTVPAPGDWAEIDLTATSSSLLEYCHIRYGGHTGLGAVRFSLGSPSTIQHCLIERSASCGVRIEGSSPFLIGNRISRNADAAVVLSGSCSPTFSSSNFPGLTNTFAGNGTNVVAHLGGTIDTSIWRRCGYPWHVLSSTTVQIGQRLTLEPGLMVKMAPGTYLATREYQGNVGNISFVGTPIDSIVITSIRDDHYGGDSNNDGAVTVPAPGDWARIDFPATGGSLLNYCHIRYAGAGSLGAVRYTLGSTSTIEHCLVDHCSSSGIRAEGASPLIVGNRVARNADAAVVLSGTCSPSFYSENLPGLANTFAGNSADVVVHLGGTIDTSTWRRCGYPWHVLSSTTAQLGQMLTLEPGLIVKMALGTVLATREYQGNTGNISFVGTPMDSIVITSIRDDQYGGDSNNDGNATNPADGDWGRIDLPATAGSSLGYCHIRYAGSGGLGAVRFTLGSPSSMANCLIDHSAAGGVRIDNANPLINGNVLVPNHGAAIDVLNCNIPAGRIEQNAFLGDANDIGMQNETSGREVWALHNYWGAANGPHDVDSVCGTNPAGAGTQVIGCVRYDPWLPDSPILPPEISIAPGEFSLRLDEGAVLDTTLTISNAGPGLLSFRLEEGMQGGERSQVERVDVPWLSLEPTAGLVVAGKDSTIHVTINHPPVGAQEAYILIHSNDPDEDLLVVRVTVNVTPAVVDGELVVPTVFALEQNTPNPFTGMTTITYQLPHQSNVSLEVFDVSGRLVAKLDDGVRAQGTRRTAWNGRNLYGRAVAPGIYFCRMRAGTFAATRAIVKF